MELYFTCPENIAGGYAKFDAFESTHILNTMRNKTGDLIHFTDGEGRLYSGHITETRPLLKAQSKLIKQLPWPPRSLSILGIGFIRPSRLDYMIEKSTELGINKFYLFASQHTNYYTENSNRWEKIARQAIKQSNQLYLPEIIILPSFLSFLEAVSSIKNKFMAEQIASNPLADILRTIKHKDENIVFLIGPEGGFEKKEIEMAEKDGFLAVSFCENRLRTETAAISAASYINLIRN